MREQGNIGPLADGGATKTTIQAVFDMFIRCRNLVRRPFSTLGNMTNRSTAFAAICATALFSIWPSGIVQAGINDLAVVDYQYVSRSRVGRRHYDYTYTITVSNSAGALQNVVANAASSSPNTVIINGVVTIGDMATGSSTQSNETFTFRQNRRYRFNPDSLSWSFTADESEPDNIPPIANAGPDQAVDLGSVVTLDGSGSSDADQDSITYAWSLTPPGGGSAALSNPNSVNPTFTADTLGNYSATLIVSDGTDDASPDSVSIAVAFNGTNPPAITSSPANTGSIDTAYSYDVNATDPDLGDTLTFSLQQAPDGMTIDPITGVINWLPLVTGPADVDVVVTDSTGLADRQIYLILVNNGGDDQAPTIAAIADQSTIAGQSIAPFAAGNDPEGEALRYGLVSAPAGMSINTRQWRAVVDARIESIGFFSRNGYSDGPWRPDCRDIFQYRSVGRDTEQSARHGPGSGSCSRCVCDGATERNRE